MIAANDIIFFKKLISTKVQNNYCTYTDICMIDRIVSELSDLMMTVNLFQVASQLRLPVRVCLALRLQHIIIIIISNQKPEKEKKQTQEI